jgi:hypothetical protein
MFVDFYGLLLLWKQPESGRQIKELEEIERN